MRDFIFICIAVFLSSFVTWLVTDRAATAQPHSTAVVADDESGVIRFMVDGRERAWIDATGFYIHGDVTYAGALTDTGDAFFAQRRKGAVDAP
jgi:hypothetical protein